MNQKIHNFCFSIIKLCSAILFVLLALFSFLWTSKVDSAYDIVLKLSWDNPLLNLLFLLLFCTILFGIQKILAKIPHGNTILLILTCLWIFTGCIVWVWLSKSGPASDCGSVYYAAKQFAKNDFSALSYRDSYFSCYPFQLGLTFFYEIIFRIVKNDNFHILQGVNAVCLIVITISQYYLSDFFFHSKKTQRFLLLLIGTCLPFIMYGSYIYGEIPSFAFLIFGTWMILMLLEKNSYLCGLLGFISIICSVLVRKNTLIFIIALTIIVFLYLLKHFSSMTLTKKLLLLLYFVLMLFLSIQIIPLVQHSYAVRSQTEINEGVPNSTYLAMGLMEAEGAPGGYNGYNFETFAITADYDSSLAGKIGMDAYKTQVSYFVQHPAYALQFFLTKFLDEWLNAGWAVFQSTYVSFGERFPLIESCFSGPLYPVMVDYMSNYQMVLYFLVAIYCIYACRKKSDKEHSFSQIFLLTAVGGALFYLAWEASGRYVLPYGIFVLPNAARGLELLFENERIQKCFKKK